MKKRSILASIALLLASPSLAQVPDPASAGRCAVSLDKADLAPGWIDPLAATGRHSSHSVSVGCMTCSPILTVGAFATNERGSEAETFEQHATTLLADHTRTESWLAGIFAHKPDNERRQDRLCQFVDKTLAARRTIAGLPFYGAEAAQRCAVGQTSVTLARILYYEAIGEGCRFTVGVTWKSDAGLSEKSRTEANRALAGIHFSVGR